MKTATSPRSVRREELLRKTLHIVGGLSPPLFILVLGWTGSLVVALFLLTYLVVAWDFQQRGVWLPIVGATIARTSRPDDAAPQGAAEFLFALVLVTILFPLPYSLATFALVGVGDGLAALIGQRWGRHPLPWNPRKTWEGLVGGTLAGAAAYVAFALVGAQLQIHGYAGMSNVWGPRPAAWGLFLILAGFPLLHAAARAATSYGLFPRSANASPQHVAAAFCLALVPPLTFLLVAPHWLEGPVFGLWGGHGPVTRAALVLVPVAAMLVESTLRRGDNLAVAAIGAGGAYAVVGALGGA